MARFDRLTGLLAGCALVLAGFIAGEIRLFGTENPPEAQGGAASGEFRNPVSPGWTMPPLSALSELRERPPFSPGRHAAAGLVSGNAVNATGLTLTGTVVAPDGRRALIGHAGSRELLHVAEGQTIGGWLLETVKTDRVILRLGPTRQELRIGSSPGTASETATSSSSPPLSQPAATLSPKDMRWSTN